MEAENYLKLLDINNISLNGSKFYTKKALKKAMVEFAKYHVEQALKESSENVKTYDIYNESTGDMECKVTFVDKQSILNAYPLDNIK